MKALVACALLGVAAAAAVPFLHPLLHEAQLFAAALAGLGLAALSTRLIRRRAERSTLSTLARRARRLAELSS